jgi:hypothetical protein
MKLSDAFPSRFLKAADLGGKPVVVEIADAVEEPLKGLDGKTTNKVVLYFKNKKKALALNRTNFESVADVTGEADSDDWIGHEIELFPTATEMAGKRTDCIRIRAVKRPPLKTAGKLPPPTPKTPGKAPETQQTESETDSDLDDDEIPF